MGLAGRGARGTCSCDVSALSAVIESVGRTDEDGWSGGTLASKASIHKEEKRKDCTASSAVSTVNSDKVKTKLLLML